MKKLIAATIVLVTFSSAALALDLTQQFRDERGDPIPNTLSPSKGSTCGESKDTKCLTLGDAMFHALVSNYQDEQSTITGEEKYRRGSLALKLSANKNLSLSAEDTVLVKKLIGKLFTPLIVAQSYQMLDPGVLVLPSGAAGGGGGAAGPRR